MRIYSLGILGVILILIFSSLSGCLFDYATKDGSIIITPTSTDTGDPDPAVDTGTDSDTEDVEVPTVDTVSITTSNHTHTDACTHNPEVGWNS